MPFLANGNCMKHSHGMHTFRTEFGETWQDRWNNAYCFDEVGTIVDPVVVVDALVGAPAVALAAVALAAAGDGGGDGGDTDAAPAVASAATGGNIVEPVDPPADVLAAAGANIVFGGDGGDPNVVSVTRIGCASYLT